MGTGILFKRLWRTARLASAIGIAGLLAATFLPSRAQAAPKASAECHGVVDNGAGGAAVNPGLPSGNFRETLSFTAGTPATLGSKSKAQAVAGSFILTVDQACMGFNPVTSAASTTSQTPCVQAGTFSGTIDVNGNMILIYSDPPSPAKAGTGLFDGCEATYLDMPVNAKTKVAGVAQAVWVPNAIPGVPAGATTGNGLIFQEPAPSHGTAPPKCVVAGTRMVFTCSATNS